MASAKKSRKAEAKAKTKTNAPPTAPGPRKKKNHDPLLVQPPRSSKTRVPRTDVHDDITNANATTSKPANGTSSWDPDHELRQVQALLAQIWHRNKNQHRGQKWWKWVSVLKRRVRDLVELAVDGAGDGTRGAGKVRSEAEEEGEAVRARKRLELGRMRAERRRQVEEWVRDVVLGRCWLSFTTLVADPQFSTLGIVLLAILARVGRLVGLPTEPPPLPALASDLLNPAAQQQQPDALMAARLAQTDVDVDRGEAVERVSAGLGRHKGSMMAVERRRREIVVPKALVTRGRETGEHGAMEIETREDELGRDDGAENETGSRLASVGDSEKTQSKTCAVAYSGSLVRRKEPAKVERMRKRRKKGNAIDELFAGLS